MEDHNLSYNPFGGVGPAIKSPDYSPMVLKIFNHYVELMQFCAKYAGVLAALKQNPYDFLTNGTTYEEIVPPNLISKRGEVNHDYPEKSDGWPKGVGLEFPRETVVQFDSNIAWPTFHIVRKVYEHVPHNPSAPLSSDIKATGWNLLRISEARNQVKYQIDNQDVVSLTTKPQEHYNLNIHGKSDPYTFVLTMPLFIPVADEVVEVHFLGNVKQREILLTCS